jgi:dihydroflavonol-4-reductase
MPKLALVTGSSGFVGSSLCRSLLESGFNVRAFHRSTSSLKLISDLDVEHAVGDITQIDTLMEAMKGVDVVFHTASKVDYWRASEGMYQIVVGGTRNVVQAALQNRVERVVYTSSVGALGVPDLQRKTGENPILINENHVWNCRPQWWRYGHAKHLAEYEIQNAVAEGLDAVIVNPSMILGPGDINHISGEIVILMAKRIVFLGIPGGMNAIHIDDVVRGHLFALEYGQRGERYILGGENETFLKFMQTTARIVGVNPPKYTIPAWVLRPLATPLDLLCHIFPMPFNGDLLRFCSYYMYYDTRKAENKLGFKAGHTYQDALQSTYDWYKSQGMM